MRTMTRRTRIAAAVAAGALLLSACGSSSGGDHASKATTTAASSSGTGSSSVAEAKKNDKLGSILATSKGLTLYTLTNGGKAVPCDATCLGAWPAATVPAGTTGTVAGVQLGTAKATDGSTILTADGQPVYTFVKDEDEEDAYGEGITSFGGTWHVVKAEGGSSAATTTTAASSRGGGY